MAFNPWHKEVLPTRILKLSVRDNESSIVRFKATNLIKDTKKIKEGKAGDIIFKIRNEAKGEYSLIRHTIRIVKKKPQLSGCGL
ncbi:MAG: hypothetical protein JW973_12405 [Bacteroidales bacterium]|nr:hypothetical protein [Bacteroidales bacterium]